MSTRSLIGPTIAAVILLLALFLVQRLGLPTRYMLGLLLLWMVGVLMFFRQAGARPLSRVSWWWSWRGALTWLGGTLAATGLVAPIDRLRGAPMTWEQWSQLVTGFLLAYILAFLVYQVLARGDGARRST